MKILSFDFRYVFILDCYIYTIMDRNSKPPVSKYLGTFFLDSAQKSEDGSNGNYKTYGLPSKKDDSSSCVHVTTLSSGLEEMSNKDNIDEIWGSDFPEDFSEDCIILEPKSEDLRDTDISICIIDKSSSHKSSDDIDVQIISSNSDYADVRKDKRPEPNIEKTRPALLMDRFSHQSQIPKKASVGPATSKSTLTISSSQSFTTEWLRNQLDKVNKEYSSLKEALIAKDGESSLLRGKLRDAEQEILKIKQQWQTTSSKERTKLEEQIKSLEKQLNSAKTQILFKSKEAESNLERYLEIKRLSIKDPEFTQVKSSSSRFRTFTTVGEPPVIQKHAEYVFASKNESEIPVTKNVDAEILKIDNKLNMGKELEFFIHPDLFNEAALEFNFVIPPSTDYYPFNVMYKDIKEMPSNDSSCEPLNLYNIWKVKRESFGEIMSNIIDITNDSDSDSDSHTDSPQKEKSLYKLLTVSGLALKSVNDDFAPSKQISQYKTLEDKNTFKKENDSNKKIFPKVELVQKIKGSHPRLAYLGKSRYFTSLREIYLPLIEMCKSSSWEQKSIDEVLKHVKNMTRELYVAMCDPSVDAYFSTMYFRDNQIIDSCSDVSELKLEYNIFSPKKWRDKEIYVDLRRGIALIKVLCDLDPKCMEVILNSALNKLPCELPMKPPQKTAFVKGKDSSCCSRNIMKQPSTAGKKQFKKDLNEKNKKEVKLDKEMEYPPQESAKRDDGNDNECHLEKISKVRKKKRMGNKQPRQYSHAIDPAEPWSWIFVEEGLPSVPGNKYHMNLDLDEALPNVNITIAYEDDRCKEKMASGYLQPTVKLSCENSDEVKLSGNQPTKTCVNKDRSSLKIKQMYVNPSASDMNPVVHKEVKLIPRQFEESSHKTHESSKLMENLEEKVNIELFDLDKKEGTNQLSILDSTIKNDHQGWVEAIESPLLTINEKSSTKQIIALRDNACCSKAEKEFLTYALSTFSKIKSNMKSGYSNEEDKGKKRKFSEDSTGHSKKLALDVLYAKDEVNEGSFITIEAVGKLISENIKPTGSSFSFKKKRDVRPLRKSIKDDAIPGTSKNEPNLDQEIEMEIQKIFNEPLDPKPNEKKKGKAKEIDSFNCDDLVKTDRLNYFINLAHSGDFLVLLFELIREIGRKIYTTNFNYLFAVVINLIHTLLKNGNPGLIQRNFLFDILQEILYCRPSPVALLQMNKLLVDVIPFQPFLTSLMCHNANSNHMIIDIEPVFFTRGACFIEVISSLIDYFMNDSDWEIQTYCVRWLSYMYLIEKTTIEEWYLTQKTVCRRCHCLVLLTSMAVKIFETASSYYLRCCIENRLTYLLSCQLLEIIQSGVKILYVMIDFDKYFSENIGDRYGMFLRFLDTVKLIHRSPEQFKEFNTNNEDFDIVQLLLIEEKVVDSIAKASKTTETINEMANLFNTQTDWPPKSFQGDRLFFSELSD